MRTLTKREPVRARSAWKPSDFPTPDAYSFTLTEAHLGAFDAAIAANRRAGRPHDLQRDPRLAARSVGPYQTAGG
jgi:hypothetical protein